MTHEELLAKIKEKDLSYSHPDSVFTMNDRANKALRAVVEILKGYDDGQVRVNEEFNQGVLSLCNVLKEAIEKELG